MTSHTYIITGFYCDEGPVFVHKVITDDVDRYIRWYGLFGDTVSDIVDCGTGPCVSR